MCTQKKLEACGIGNDAVDLKVMWKLRDDTGLRSNTSAEFVKTETFSIG